MKILSSKNILQMNTINIKQAHSVAKAIYSVHKITIKLKLVVQFMSFFHASMPHKCKAHTRPHTV